MKSIVEWGNKVGIVRQSRTMPTTEVGNDAGGKITQTIVADGDGEETSETEANETTEDNETTSKKVEIINDPGSRFDLPTAPKNLVIAANETESLPASSPITKKKPQNPAERKVLVASSHYPEEVVITYGDPTKYEIKKGFFNTLLRIGKKKKKAQMYHEKYCYDVTKEEKELDEEFEDLARCNRFMEKCLINYEYEFWTYNHKPPKYIDCLVRGRCLREANLKPEDRYQEGKDPYYWGRKRSRKRKYQRHIFNAQLVFNREAKKLPPEYQFNVKFVGMQWLIGLPLLQVIPKRSNRGVIILANLTWNYVRIGFLPDPTGSIKITPYFLYIGAFCQKSFEFTVTKDPEKEITHQLTYYYMSAPDYAKIKDKFDPKDKSVTGHYYGYGTVVVVTKPSTEVTTNEVSPEVPKADERCKKLIAHFRKEFEQTLTAFEVKRFKRSTMYDSDSDLRERGVIHAKRDKRKKDVATRNDRYKQRHLTVDSLAETKYDTGGAENNGKIKAGKVPEECERKDEKGDNREKKEKKDDRRVKTKKNDRPKAMKNESSSASRS